MKRRLQFSILYCCLAWLCVAADGRGNDWILLFDRNGFWTSNVNLPASKTLTELLKENVNLKCVAFTSNGGYAILFGPSGYVADDIPKDALKKLSDIAQADGTIKWIAFAPTGGWVIFYDKNSYASHGIPDEARQKLQEIAGKDGTLRSITFMPGGGYVLFWDQDGSWCHGPGLPDDAFRKIVDVGKAGGKFKMIAFTPTGGCSFFWDRNSSWNIHVPEAAAQKIERAGTGGGTLKMIAFTQDNPYDPSAPYVLDAKPGRRVKAVLTTDIAYPHAHVDEWYLYAPCAPNLPGQRSVNTTFEPAGKLVQEESPLKRPVFLPRITDGRKTVHTVLTIEATLYSRRLRPLAADEAAPTVNDLPAAQAKWYARSCVTANFNARSFQTWMAHANLKREVGESDMAFAHRTFAYIKHHCKYELTTKNHSASQTCAAGKSNCGGLSALFTALMRANGVPARLLGGRWAVSEKPEDKKYHVKAEFFAHGVGWVPVDAAGAVGDTAGGDFAFFGNDPGDFIAMANDEDLVLDSFHWGKQNYGVIQGLIYWWLGVGPETDSRFADQWTVEKLR